MFARIVKMIDRDFKTNLSISGNSPVNTFTSITAEENKKIASTAGDTGLAATDDSTIGPKGKGDVVEKYGENMGGADKLLMRFMSSHQYLNLSFVAQSHL